MLLLLLLYLSLLIFGVLVSNIELETEIDFDVDGTEKRLDELLFINDDILCKKKL